MKIKFTAGDEAWTKQGEKVHVVDVTTSGRYLIAPMVEYGGSYEEPPTVDLGAFVLVDELLDEPPKKLVDPDIAKAKQELETIRSQISDARSELTQTTAERTRLVDKLKQVPALRYIEEMLEGRLKFVVIERHGEYKVMPVEKAIASEDGWRAETRLVSLAITKKRAFPGQGTELQWQINKYHDGSGQDYRAWFYETEDQAKSAARALIESVLVDAYEKYTSKREDGGYYASSLVSQAKMLEAAGGAVPEAVRSVLSEARRKTLLATIEQNERHARGYNDAAKKAQEELAALVNEERQS